MAMNVATAALRADGADGADGAGTTFEAIARIDNATDIAYLVHGGVLPMVLRELMASAA